jgi:hypothetical protein
VAVSIFIIVIVVIFPASDCHGCRPIFTVSRYLFLFSCMELFCFEGTLFYFFSFVSYWRDPVLYRRHPTSTARSKKCFSVSFHHFSVVCPPKQIVNNTETKKSIFESRILKYPH